MSLARTTFTPVDHYRVTREIPCTSSETIGLDFERCSALHNAIVQYGWIASGQRANDYTATSWWEYWSAEAPQDLPRLENELHPSISRFLKRAVPQSALRGNNSQNEQNFFYTVAGLSSPTAIVSLADEVGEEELITLYMGHDDLSDTFHGIMYVLVSSAYHPFAVKLTAIATIQGPTNASSTHSKSMSCIAMTVTFAGSPSKLCSARIWT